ncbi:MAG: arginine--tRNA ligase, partial [Candidatus Aenigmarchaeota archaeon]|nr:arginine--tRNA ligase [Candidatus Aenigmarchaeota archaeon]
MNLMQEFRKDVVKILSRQVPRKLVEKGLEKPPENIGADLAYPCFVLARKKKKNPAEIAKEISSRLKPAGLVGEVNFYGPYINFFIGWKDAAPVLLRAVLKEKEKYGRGKSLDEKYMIEFAHPNTHKAFHIGHVRNICLGESLSRILENAGYRVVRTNYQGDIGPHVAKCLWGLINLYKEKIPKKDPGKWLGGVYSDASKRIFRSKKAEKEMREINNMLYARDKKIMPIWKKTRKLSLDYFDGIYKDFGAKFDRLYMESEVEAEGLDISKRLVKKRVARVSDDAIIVNLEKQKLGVFVLVTKDNTPLYHAKDLALAQLQVKEYNPDRIIHVVGSEQTFYFRQLFKLLEVMKWPHHEKEFHMIYELVNLSSGKKMKSREGEVILYDEFKEKLLKLARRETKEKNPKLSAKELDSITSLIGMGALKYTMLSQSPEKTIVFNWDNVLSFDGDTGPYVQYSHVRAMSILRKA